MNLKVELKLKDKLEIKLRELILKKVKIYFSFDLIQLGRVFLMAFLLF